MLIHDEDAKLSRWDGEIIRQLELSSMSDVVKGGVFFRFSHLKGVLGDQIKDYYNYRGFAPRPQD